MGNKILWRQIFGVVLVGIGGGLVWQWFQSSMFVAGIVGAIIMLLGICLIFSKQLRKQAGHHQPNP